MNELHFEIIASHSCFAAWCQCTRKGSEPRKQDERRKKYWINKWQVKCTKVASSRIGLQHIQAIWMIADTCILFQFGHFLRKHWSLSLSWINEQSATVLHLFICGSQLLLQKITVQNKWAEKKRVTGNFIEKMILKKKWKFLDLRMVKNLFTDKLDWTVGA